MKIHEDKFSYGIFLIVSIISISMLAFLNEDKNITGYVIAGESANYESASALAEFNSLNSLAQLSPGLYYVYADGYVYSVDDYSRLLVGKVSHLEDSQKDKLVYIDRNGNIGYVLDFVENG